MQRLIFGQLVPSDLGVYQLAPLTHITAMYKQVISSAMKTYLSGGMLQEMYQEDIPRNIWFSRRLWAMYLHLRFYSCRSGGGPV